MSLYSLAIIGAVPERDRAVLIQTISEMVSDFGLSIGREITVHDSATVGDRSKRGAFAAVYFGGDRDADSAAALKLLEASAVIIPTVGPNQDFATSIPDFLIGLNGLRRRADDLNCVDLASVVLESLGLLRRQRRVFVSYRRTEARAAAVQLHDLLTARQFDVFLDTHSIRPGEPFQDVLWQRLCDSDVLVMLDTPTYFESKWTRQELGRARAKEVHILRVNWPEHIAHKSIDFGETIYLDRDKLKNVDGPISEDVAESIVTAVESLRSRSIAARYQSISGRLKTEVHKIGGTVVGIGAHRAISISLPDATKLWAYPVVGIPTAELLNDVAEKAKRAAQEGTPLLVYDHIGIRDQWAAHLRWLDDNIRSVRALKVHEAAWTLAAWEP